MKWEDDILSHTVLSQELLSYLEQVPTFKSVEGAVLIFMPGLAQIQQLYEMLQADPNFSKTDR